MWVVDVRAAWQYAAHAFPQVGQLFDPQGPVARSLLGSSGSSSSGSSSSGLAAAFLQGGGAAGGLDGGRGRAWQAPDLPHLVEIVMAADPDGAYQAMMMAIENEMEQRKAEGLDAGP